MKEWKKPCMEVVVLDERDVIATSTQIETEEGVALEQGSNKGNIWTPIN